MGYAKPVRTFNIIECSIVLLLVATVAVVALPLWASERVVNNEEVAIRMLSTIMKAQTAFKERNGTYGLLEELTGTNTSRDIVITPPLLAGSESWQGALTVGGYAFVIYLSDANGGGAQRPRDIDPKWADRFWVAYAWPINYGMAGRRLFGVSSDGKIWAQDNSIDSFTGSDDRPPPNFLARRLDSNNLNRASATVQSLYWIEVKPGS